MVSRVLGRGSWVATLCAVVLAGWLAAPATAQRDVANEEELPAAGYTYDPGDRRDPFVSLLDAPATPRDSRPRPPGIPGLLIDEIRVSGIFTTSRGTVAQVRTADREETYLLRPGDRLFDGEVIVILDGEVVFRQEVREATALKPFREVVKKLNP